MKQLTGLKGKAELAEVFGKKSAKAAACGVTSG